jgi:hypothetical protein
MLPKGPATRAVAPDSERLELRTLWSEVVRAVRGTVGDGESRRRAPYGGPRDGAPAAARNATDEARPDARRLLVALEEGEDRGRMARYFRSLGWTVDVGVPGAGPDAGAHGHDLAIVDLGAVECGAAAGFDRLRAIRRHDPGAIIIVLGNLAPAMETQARVLGADAIVRPPHYLPDLGHLAFSLTGVLRG